MWAHTDAYYADQVTISDCLPPACLSPAVFVLDCYAFVAMLKAKVGLLNAKVAKC